MNITKRSRSREYPAVSLKKAIELARRIYEKDGWNEAPALSAVKHMGYSSLNGVSRGALSALKKFGLLEYTGGGPNLKVKLTELTKRILLALNETERAEAVREALGSPSIYADLSKCYPNWELPSDETVGALLEREFGLQRPAIHGFVADLRESIEYAKQFGNLREDPIKTPEAPSAPGGSFVDSTLASGDQPTQRPPGSVEAGQIRLQMPGSVTCIVIPERIDDKEGRRMLAWLNRVVKPAIEFASEPAMALDSCEGQPARYIESAPAGDATTTTNCEDH